MSLSYNLDNIKEAVKNALNNPFSVTNSTFIEKATDEDLFSESGLDIEDYQEIDLGMIVNRFYNSNQYGNGELAPTTDPNNPNWSATKLFTKEDLPLGTVIVLDDGYAYRPEGWKADGSTNNVRPEKITTPFIIVTEDWWGEWTTRGFNIAKTNGGSLTNYTNDQINEVIQIYIPKK